MPNLLPNVAPWVHPAGRLIWSLIVLVIAFAIVGYLFRRPKSERPATWAQCMFGAVATFAMFFLCYGVVPHEFITFANGYLHWSNDKFLFTTRPIKVPYSTVRDLVMVGIYGVFVVIQLALWILWQKRPTAAELEARRAAGGRRRFGLPRGAARAGA